MRERQGLEDNIRAIEGLTRALDDNTGLIELGEEEGDAAIVAEAEAAIRSLSGEIKARQIETMLSGEADANDSYLEVHAGAGGTESQDWAAMLLRMYAGRAPPLQGQCWRSTTARPASIGDAADRGHNAYGWLKTGRACRLVRISPYDSNARRHASFASAWVYRLSTHIEIDVDGSQVRDLTASSGRWQRDTTVRLCASRISRPASRSTAGTRSTEPRTPGPCAGSLKAELQKREERPMRGRLKTDIGWGRVGLRAQPISWSGPAHRLRAPARGCARRRPR